MSSSAEAGVTITLGILFIIGATTAIIVWSWHRVQKHRADAVAMAAYRKLAEEAVSNQSELRDEMRKLAEHMGAIEQLMRDVG